MKRKLAGTSAVLSSCLLALSISGFSQNVFKPSYAGEQSLIQINTPEESQPHPITLKDILSTREIREPQISPDGKRVAFVVKQAFLDQNTNRSALFVMSTHDQTAPTKLVEEQSLSQIKWTVDGRFITYLSSRSGSSQIWRVNHEGGTPEALTHHSTGISQYSWSPNGKKIAFYASAPVEDVQRQRMESEGVVYDESLSFFDIASKNWIKRPQLLWVYDVETQKEELISKQDSVDSGWTSTELAWSPDNRKIALVMFRPPKDVRHPFNYDLVYVSLDTGKLIPILTWGGVNRDVSWSPDGESILFRSAGGAQSQKVSYKYSLFTLNLKDGKPKQLVSVIRGIKNPSWSKDGTRIIFSMTYQRSKSSLYEVPANGGQVRKISKGDDHLDDFSFDREQLNAVCIRQNTMTPPEVAIVNLNDGVPTTLTAINRQYENIKLGEVSELRWTNKYGNETNGFLIKPIGYRKGTRYPFVLILYGFSAKFVYQAQWNPNYPAQAFAANGFAVLLMNENRVDLDYDYGNFKEGSMAEAYNPMASIEKAVELVTTMGIADPKRTGIMGWSYGSFLTDFTITHSELFNAASSGDGGLWSMGAYWMSSREHPKFHEGILGGPPWGNSYKNWREFVPSLNANRIRVPVLMEYVDSNPTGFEFYTALKREGKQVELVIYPNEAHTFSQPRHRFYSMQRNLDWFNFWLQDKEDTAPAKREQYARWRVMREAEKGNQLVTR